MVVSIRISLRRLYLSRFRDSNPVPTLYESVALPDELNRHLRLQRFYQTENKKGTA